MVESESGNLLARVAQNVRKIGLAASSLALVIMISTSSANAAEKTWQQCLSCGTDKLMQRKTADAESSFRQAVAAVERVPHKPDEKAECLYQLAHVLAMEEKTDESIEYYSQSFHVLEEAYGTRSPKLVTTLYRLGAGYKEKGDLDSAKKLYKLAFEISLNAGSQKPAVASGLENIGKSQIDTDDALAMGRYVPTPESLKEQASLPNSKLLSTSPSAGSLEAQQDL